jgi:hypothetical protein
LASATTITDEKIIRKYEYILRNSLYHSPLNQSDGIANRTGRRR